MFDCLILLAGLTETDCLSVCPLQIWLQIRWKTFANFFSLLRNHGWEIWGIQTGSSKEQGRTLCLLTVAITNPSFIIAQHSVLHRSPRIFFTFPQGCCLPFPRVNPKQVLLVYWLSKVQSHAPTSCLLDFDWVLLFTKITIIKTLSV